MKHLINFSAIIIALNLMACGESTTSKADSDSTSVVSGVPINNNPTPPTPVKDTIETENPAETGNCYMKTSGRDTVLMQINIAGSTVTGKLKYDNYQYDGSAGTLKGIIEGDILKLWYNFQAEGTNSVRQLYFKQTGDRLLFATGEQVNRGDSSVYKDPRKVGYSGSDFLRKWDCKEINL